MIDSQLRIGESLLLPFSGYNFNAEYFVLTYNILGGKGGKGGRCVRLTTLPPSCAVVMKSGNLNFLEPSGPLQACNGTALPLLQPIGVA